MLLGSAPWLCCVTCCPISGSEGGRTVWPGATGRAPKRGRHKGQGRVSIWKPEETDVCGTGHKRSRIDRRRLEQSRVCFYNFRGAGERLALPLPPVRGERARVREVGRNLALSLTRGALLLLQRLTSGDAGSDPTTLPAVRREGLRRWGCVCVRVFWKAYSSGIKTLCANQ